MKDKLLCLNDMSLESGAVLPFLQNNQELVLTVYVAFLHLGRGSEQ